MGDTRKPITKQDGIKVIRVDRTPIAPAQKLQKEGPKKAGHRFDYKDRIIAGEAIAIMALAVLFYISQAGPIF